MSSLEELRAQIRNAEQLKAQLMEERREELKRSLSTLYEYLKLLDEAERVYAYDDTKKLWLADTRADVRAKIEKRKDTQKEIADWIASRRLKDKSSFPIHTDDCIICLEAEPLDAQACIYCLSVVGCRPCVQKWNVTKTRLDHLPCCPRCRHLWAIDAGVLDVNVVEEEESKP